MVNEDWIEPGTGFGTHPHRDMEIVTYMIDGALEHKDSMGNGSVIRPGELQRMTAGTGVLHSEYNHSEEEKAHLLQIWILPERNGLEPGYEQKLFPSEEKRNQWRLVGSRDGREGSLTIHQDVNLWSTELEEGNELEYAFDGQRRGFLQVVRGAVEVEGNELVAGDAVATQDHPALRVRANIPLECPHETRPGHPGRHPCRLQRRGWLHPSRAVAPTRPGQHRNPYGPGGRLDQPAGRPGCRHRGCRDG